MIPDPKNSMTWTQLLASKSHATNNVGSAGLDTRGYVGKLACYVNIGVKTAGDNDGTVNVVIKASATNDLANATNIVGETTNAVATTNNTAAAGVVSFDTRAEYRYLFALVTLTGTNSPAYPVSVAVAGEKQFQAA
jgi:hypothetical protein